jgi:hypothetical protein
MLPLKSPAGTTEKVNETWSWIRGADREFSTAEYFEMEVPGVASGYFSRPYGTFRLSNLYPGLRPGLSSAVPTGLDIEMVVLTQGLSALFQPGLCGTADAVPFVQMARLRQVVAARGVVEG